MKGRAAEEVQGSSRVYGIFPGKHRPVFVGNDTKGRTLPSQIECTVPRQPTFSNGDHENIEEVGEHHESEHNNRVYQQAG
jgi:hypothetical protein